MGKVRLSLWAFAASSAVAWTAAAAPQWRLTYIRETDAAGCPEEMELRMAVAARLGRDPFSTGAKSAVVARIAQHGDELAGSVELIDEAGISRGQRELSANAATCDEMARALAVSISIAVDPERALTEETSEIPAVRRSEAAKPAPQPPVPQPVPHAAEYPPQHDVVPPAFDARPHTSSLSLAAVSMWGVAPGLAWGGSLRFERRLGWFTVGGGALALTSPGDSVAAVGTLDTSFAAGELEACATRGMLTLCAVGLLGTTWARAHDVVQPHTDAGLFLAGGGRLGLVVPVSRAFAFFADASLLSVALPVGAAVDGEEVWRAPPLAIALAAGAKFHFL